MSLPEVIFICLVVLFFFFGLVYFLIRLLERANKFSDADETEDDERRH